MRCLRRAISIFLLAALFLVSPMSMVFAQDAPVQNGTTGGGTTAATPQQSAKCTEVFAAVTPTKALSKDDQDKVFVILGESISADFPKNTGYNCSDVAQCLNEQHQGKPDRANLVINEMKQKYGYCLVTGADGLGLLANYASMVYRWIAGIVGGICILTIVISGVQYSIGGLDSEAAGAAKDRIMRSLGGMVILFLSAFILYTINPLFFT